MLTGLTCVELNGCGIRSFDPICGLSGSIGYIDHHVAADHLQHLHDHLTVVVLYPDYLHFLNTAIQIQFHGHSDGVLCPTEFFGIRGYKHAYIGCGFHL